MKTSKVALTVLVLCLSAFGIVLVMTAHQLPERVASHFGPTGTADGWMSRTSHLWTMAAFGSALSVLLPGLFYCLRFLPASGINLPSRDYWLAPDRREETYRIFLVAGVWLASLQVLLLLGLHLLVVQANTSQPPRMSNSVFILGGGFLLAIGVWAYLLVRRFSKTV